MFFDMYTFDNIQVRAVLHAFIFGVSKLFAEVEFNIVGGHVETCRFVHALYFSLGWIAVFATFTE